MLPQAHRAHIVGTAGVIPPKVETDACLARSVCAREQTVGVLRVT